MRKWVLEEIKAFEKNKGVAIKWTFDPTYEGGELQILMTIGDVSCVDSCYLGTARRKDLHRILATLKQEIDYRIRKRNSHYNRRNPNHI